MDQTRLNFLFKFKNTKNVNNLFFYYGYENAENLRLNKDFSQNIINTNFLKINRLIFDCYDSQYLNYVNLDLNEQSKSLFFLKKKETKLIFKKKIIFKKLNVKEVLSNNKVINLIYF